MTLSIASLSTIPFWWLCPESVKWLYSAGKAEQGRQILEQLARQKNVKLPDVIVTDLPADDGKEGEKDDADNKLLVEEKKETKFNGVRALGWCEVLGRWTDADAQTGE